MDRQPLRDGPEPWRSDCCLETFTARKPLAPRLLAQNQARKMLTMTGEEATFTVAGRVVVPGVTATVLTMVVPAGTLSTVGAEEGGIFWVAAAAAASAAMPLIWGLLPITCNGHREREPQGTLGPGPPPTSPGGLLAPGSAPTLDSYHGAGPVTPRPGFASSSGSFLKTRVLHGSLLTGLAGPTPSCSVSPQASRQESLHLKGPWDRMAGRSFRGTEFFDKRY